MKEFSVPANTVSEGKLFQLFITLFYGVQGMPE